MIDKEKLIQTVYERKIIAIFRNIPEEKSLQTANALYNGGIRLCEVTFNMKDKNNNFASTLNSVRNILKGRKGRDLYVGVGTVLTTEQVILARDAGAEFIITPSINTDVIRLANQMGMMTIPGGYTPTELEMAYEAGADFVKIFPASEAGASYFKAVSAPLKHIPLIAVGGVDLDNMESFYNAGCVGFGIGGNLVNKNYIEEGCFSELTSLARQYADKAASFCN